MAQEIKPGIYKGRAVAGSGQWGLSEANQAQVAIDVLIPALEYKATIPLSFAPKAQRFSIERLRACGWSGKDVRKLDGIEKNEIDVSIALDQFEGKVRWKCEIMTRGGTFELSHPMTETDLDAFAEDVLAVIEADERDAKRASGAKR